MQSKILLVEDDVGLQGAVRESIGDLWSVQCAGSLADAEISLNAEAFDLVLLDVNLPDGLGFTFCEKLRSNDKFRHLPVIFLTGMGDVDSKVHGLNIGADDYILKPFERKEFIARIKAKLRAPKVKPNVFVKGNFRVDLKSVRAWVVQKDGTSAELGLTPNEFKLLVHFLEHENEIFSRDQLLKALWGETVHVSTHTIDTHISSLRKKLGPQGALIRAVVKQGYTFTLPAT